MGKNINEMDETNRILIGIYITYSVLSQFPLRNTPPCTVNEQPNKDYETEALFD